MSSLGSGTGKLVFAQGISMAVGLVTAPVIARLFSPLEFGVAGVVRSLAGWLGAFICLSYARAIPLAKDRAETSSLIKICLAITVFLFIPVVLITFLGRDLLCSLTGTSAIGPLVWFLPLLFLTDSVAAIARDTCSRERRFGLLAISMLARGSLGQVLLVLLGLLLGGRAFYLLLGTLVSSALGAAIALGLVVSILIQDLLKQQVETENLLCVAKRHKQFPTAHVWSSVLLAASHSVPVLIVGAYFGATILGFYVFGHKLLMLPIRLFARNTAKVFYPEAALEWRHTGGMAGTIRRSMRILSRACMFPMVAVGILDPVLYTTLFGLRWSEAGIYAQILSPWMLLVVVALPMSKVFLIRQRAHTLLIYNAVLLLGRIGAIIAGAHLGGARTAIALFAAVGVMVFLHQFVLAMRFGKAKARDAAPLVHEAVRAFVLLLPAAAAYWIGARSFMTFSFLGVAVLLHAASIYRREPVVRRKVHQFISRVNVRKVFHAATAWTRSLTSQVD